MNHKVIAIAGYMGAGKTTLANALKSNVIIPNAQRISMGDVIREYAVANGLMAPDVSKSNNIEAWQNVKPPRDGHWQALVINRVREAQSEGLLPIIDGIRTHLDEVMAKMLGAPMILVRCDRERRISRIMWRDKVTRERVESYMDNPTTEGYVQHLEIDFTFRNDINNLAREFARLLCFLD